MLTKIIVGILGGIACYFILADLLRVPYMRTSKAIRNLAKLQNEKTSGLDIWLGNFASSIAKRMKMNEYKKQELEVDLKTAQMRISPEMFTANAIVKSLIIGVLAIPMFFIFPISSPVILVLAFIMYRIYMKSVGMKIKDKRAKIENNLPRLVATIEKTLKRDRSITNILREFSKNAGPELKYELDIVLADIQSGNEEAAITRLEARVGSTMMTDVCRGLIMLVHGDAAEIYWASLVMKFSEHQRTMLKTEAEKIPRKVRRLSICLLLCFMLIYIVVILSQIMSSFGVMFG